VVSSSIFFYLLFSSPNLNAGSLEIQDAKMTQKIAISAASHNFAGLYLRN